MVSEELRAMIPDYVRGLLSPAEAKEVEAALETEPEIYPEFEAAQSYYTALNQIPEVTAPADFLDRVNRGIDKAPLWPGVRRFLFEPLAVKLPVELSGLAACLIVAVFFANPFSIRERLSAGKIAAAKTPAAAVAAAKKAEPEPAPTAPTPPPEPPAEATAARQLPMPETQVPVAAAPGQPAPAAEAPAIAAGYEPSKIQEQKSAAIAEVKNNDAKGVAAYSMADKKTETVQKPAAAPAAALPPAPAPAPAAALTRAPAPAPASAPAPAPAPAAAARRAPSLDNIPALPSVAAVAPAPAPEQGPPAEPAPRAFKAKAALEQSAAKEQIVAKVKTTAEDIGTVDLSTDPLSSSSTAENAEIILQTAASRCKKTMKDGKTAFECALPPERLDLLNESLSRSFTVTTHLFPFDAATAKLVKVTFVIQ